MAQITRSYNQVSTDLPRSPYRRKLTALGKALWDDLCAWPTYCGLFSVDVEERAWYHGANAAEIDDLLEKFRADGKIRRDGAYVWLLEFVEHQSYHPNLRKAAAKEALSLQLRTDLASEAYANLTGTLPEPSPILDKTRLDKIINPHARLAAGAAPEAGKLKLPEDPGLLQLTERCAAVIKRACEVYSLGKPPRNDTSKSAITISQVIRLDGIPESELLPAIQWAMRLDARGEPLTGEPQFDWRPVLQSIPQWRKLGAGGLPKIKSAWLQWKKATGGLKPPDKALTPDDIARIKRHTEETSKAAELRQQSEADRRQREQRAEAEREAEAEANRLAGLERLRQIDASPLPQVPELIPEETPCA